MDGTPKIAFRADAGVQIGHGHVMRCLTLADELAAHGARCTFMTRPQDGDLCAAIEDRGHFVYRLGTCEDGYGDHPDPPAHASWLGRSWRIDATECRALLEGIAPDWLVVDHYALDTEWQSVATPKNTKLMVIDDLADRPHQADILLDQNFGRDARAYCSLVPTDCRILVGPQYALLRPEFARHRPLALARREKMEPRQLLVTMGGVDKENVTGQVLTALSKVPQIGALSVNVLLSQSAPWHDAVKQQASEIGLHVKILKSPTNIAEIMTQADFCIGSVGSTALERCALGLPTLQIPIASNQVFTAARMHDEGIAFALPSPDDPEFLDAIDQSMKFLLSRSTYLTVARRAASHVDGSRNGRVE